MNVSRRTLSATCAALVAALVVVAPAGASTLEIQLPANPQISKPISVVYAGVADSPGTSAVTGSGPNMQLRTFYQTDGAGCQTTSAAQRTAPNSKFDGDMFVESPAPFSLTSTFIFDVTGSFRICAYLEEGLTNDTIPPAAFAEALLVVKGPPIPCTVPKLSGLTVPTATKKLKAAGCNLGKVSKPRRVSKKAKLVIRSQSVAPSVVLSNGFKVNVVVKVKKKK